MAHPIIHFDYESSPYGQKIRSVLTATSTPFLRADVPAVLPRPLLESLGITYRRIPVLAVGKDVYADTSLIIELLQSGTLSQSNGTKPLPTTQADQAYELFGNQVFRSALSMIPPQALTPEFVKDRITIFPFLNRADVKSGELRPNGLAEWRKVLAVVEEEFLANGPYIAGPKLGLADLHIGFAAKWALEKLGIDKEPGFDSGNFPRVWEWREKLPVAKFGDVSGEEAKKQVLGAQYSAKEIGVDLNDYLALKKGVRVSVESLDTEPGAHPQFGTLIGLDTREVVLELESGVRLHFPRRGYVVKKAEKVEGKNRL